MFATQIIYMNNKISLTTTPDEVVMNKIYLIKNQKVMIDVDLAELYGVETKRVNEQVKRNLDRFPEDFMFQLTEKEFENLKSQFATSSWGGTRKLPFVFTEQGVAMLSSVLNSPKAIQVNIQIMRIFTRIRQMLTDNTELRLAIEKLEKISMKNTKSIELIFQYIDELTEKQDKIEKKRIQSQPSNPIGYKLTKNK
jgi:ORF6N domain